MALDICVRALMPGLAAHRFDERHGFERIESFALPPAFPVVTWTACPAANPCKPGRSYFRCCSSLSRLARVSLRRARAAVISDTGLPARCSAWE